MSEQVNTSAPASEPAQPEPASQPKKGDKKKLWVMIVAVIVAIALIGTAVYVLVIGGDEEEIPLELEVEILPSDDITFEAKQMIVLSVSSNLVNEAEGISHDVDDWTNVTYDWDREPYELGDFDLLAKREVEFTATNVSMTGTVSCTVSWEDEEVTVTADVTINPPYLDSVFVTPSVKTLSPDQPYEFTASASSSVGEAMTGLTYTWTVEGLDEDNYTLSSTTGESVTFTGLVVGNVTLNATATDGDITKTGSAAVQIGGAPMRTLDFYYYDMFNVPFGEWWDLRYVYYDGTEEVVTNEFPYIFIWRGNDTNIWYYGNQRLEIEGKNMPEINMNEDPVFIPMLGTATGGTAKIDWYMQYLTTDEMERYPDATAAWLDGWIISLNGTVTLDKTAAMAVMGITSEGFDDFETWWAGNSVQFLLDYTTWIMDQGNEVYDIYCSYDYSFMPYTFNVGAEKVGEEIILHYDSVSWGMEMLMARWFAASFMPNSEWYYEDMTFQATIGPEYTDLYVDTAVVYAIYAYESTVDRAPIWMWETLMQDYLPSTGSHPYSLFDVYEGSEYLNLAPGSPWYEQMMPYDYAPGAHNLSENETLVIDWPDSDELIFYGHGGAYEVDEYIGAMTCDYSEPDWVEFPGQVVLDQSARTLTFTGPIDFWTWSKYQGELYSDGLDTRYEGLGSEWDRLDLFPYGCPTIEFRMKSDIDPVASSFRVEGIPNPTVEGALSDVTVTALDQYGTPFTTYTGTIEFSSSDPANTTLPAQYTFAPADLGMKTFEDAVSFSAPGVYSVYVEDASDPSISGSQDDIVVAAEILRVPTQLLVQGVTDPIMEGTASGFTVTVLDQFHEPYNGESGDYLGTISFSSSDVLADLPADYTFTALDAGTHTWADVDGVVFHTPGMQDLTAYDVDNVSISGSQVLVVEEMPVPTSFEVVLSEDSVIANYTLLSVTVTALDQFGDPITTYVGDVEFSSTDSEAWFLMTDLTFAAEDLGVKTWTEEIVMGTPGLQTITVADVLDESMNGSDTVTVTPEPEATYFLITDMAPTVRQDVAETFTVTVYDQYDMVYWPYEGTVTFDTVPADSTLPSDYTFDWTTDMGTHDFDVTFTAEGTFSLTCTDTADASITGSVDDILVTNVDPELDHFVVEGVESPMWEDNRSDVTVTAYDQFNNVFVSYVGTIEFTTDAAAGTYDLPADYTFLISDDGVKTFVDGVMFEEGGTYTVTVTDTVGGETGEQTGISVIELVPTELVISGEPTGEVEDGELFGLTVSVYHQFDELCVEYDGTVEFTSSDSGATLPADYTFTALDAGTHTFEDAFALVASGDQTITAEDTVVSALTDTVTVTVVTPPQREVEYKIYDFLGYPMGEWWEPRWDGYSTDIVVSTGDHANAYLYYVSGAGGDDPLTQGEIYAPYRYNITASNLTSLNVHSPEFIDTVNAPVTGAEADMSLYMQYATHNWWLALRTDWLATGYAGALPNLNYVLTAQDGYIVLTEYDITMNREAAYEWIGLPTAEGDPEGWYDVNGATYTTNLDSWILNEGDVRLDIAYGYEDSYYSLYTASRLFYDSGEDEVNLEVLHFSWGYEVLMTRWLTEAEISPNHEPWYEDFRLNVSYGEEYTDLSMDGVCQYSLHAVEADGTTGGSAWAWEPGHIDYCVEEELPGFVDPDIPSEYLPYYTLSYESHNAGDNLFGEQVSYEYTPYWFNLSEGEKLIFEMPSVDVLGYDGVGLDYTDYADAEIGDLTAFEAIETTGALSLGYYYSGGPVMTQVGQTITVEGPVSFDNLRHTPGGPLTHGAPWMEFDVGGTKLAAQAPAAPAESVSAEAASVAPAGASASSEMLSLAAVVCATMLAVAALGAGRKVYA